ncbi:MAG TPA: aspartate carbamoyltransferase [Kiritimatiellia bacterium]|nr:aspartate carbamoyltransferase [Kiritimatiellia bacterium]HOM59172.1 aspartate carbamoyltransferase [Kiritimatiellia bacterium]HOR97289.1 aspartate carbamoyltransferase [Kiritimatiellia bacterium]HPC48785.1 aspartate carbamoyltransferase [Kiritimatiellia bacterium]HPK36898.1 aspartate carbamoyltransferase [Kiritimatiellia bacterium]
MIRNMSDITWEAFEPLPFFEKATYLMQENGMPYHTLFAQQFGYELLDKLATLANEIRSIAKTREGTGFLREQASHKRAMLYFSQPSSRTFLSFVSACQILGVPTGEVRDTSISSEFKGESREDSVRTFSSYFDLIIMRTPEKGLAERMAWALSNSERPIPIINAGSGQDQHPTQALLDIYTLLRSFERSGGLRDRTVVFCGDLLRGRTVRSLSYLLTNYPNIRQIFVAPPSLQVCPDVLAMLKGKDVTFELTDDFRAAIRQADAVYMTRIQDEWDAAKGDSDKIDTRQFKFGLDELKILPQHAILMHPLPRRDEISKSVDSDPRAMYWRQMRNGMWIRAALIAVTFGCEKHIHEYFRQND